MRPRLIDLCCCAGAASMGYHRAGWDVTGVDINLQPNYPFTFWQADALDVVSFPAILDQFDAAHGSPPCQRHSRMSNCRPGLAGEYPDLIAPLREALDGWGGPYVLENVVGAPLRPDAVLCGHMFGLPLYRHRVFEANFPISAPAHPQHVIPASKAGHWRPGTIISVSGHVAPVKLAREAMGVDWTTREELAEAIPPAYTEFIGEQLMQHLRAAA